MAEKSSGSSSRARVSSSSASSRRPSWINAWAWAAENRARSARISGSPSSVSASLGVRLGRPGSASSEHPRLDPSGLLLVQLRQSQTHDAI